LTKKSRNVIPVSGETRTDAEPVWDALARVPPGSSARDGHAAASTKMPSAGKAVFIAPEDLAPRPAATIL